MKWLCLSVMLFGLVLVGCALLDSATGVQHDPVTDQPIADPNGGIIQRIGQLGGSIPGPIGWILAGLGALGAVYQQSRVNGWRSAAQAGLEAAGKVLAMSSPSNGGDANADWLEEVKKLLDSPEGNKLASELMDLVKAKLLK